MNSPSEEVTGADRRKDLRVGFERGIVYLMAIDGT
jgi:hypothetical protein